ncbi:hypothetical protein L2E82_40354 [Cichorium intybus]|uniref:Uncharacterized protein n=1 Tax=Cichorium intybus TaxID=13427 RepID=A0ACB9AKW7_CICIN|nr:hypothetical protein L2E82_40354 [Cichorium intybus]
MQASSPQRFLHSMYFDENIGIMNPNDILLPDACAEKYFNKTWYYKANMPLGHEGSGKKTFALDVIEEAQKLGDPMLLEMVGVNTKNLLILQENHVEKHTALHSAENLLSIVDTLTQSGADDVIVIDSVRKSFQKTLMALERYSYYIYKSGEIKFEITQGVRVNEFFGYGKIDGVRKEYTLALETVIG